MEIDIERMNKEVNKTLDEFYKKAYDKGYRQGRMSAFLEAIEMVKNQEQIKIDGMTSDLYKEQIKKEFISEN